MPADDIGSLSGVWFREHPGVFAGKDGAWQAAYMAEGQGGVCGWDARLDWQGLRPAARP
ncbi:MAG: hypothetical protein HoeaKO_13870 [Hoeflea alexandrii]